MSFRKISGKTKIVYLPVTTSTAIAKGSLVAFSSGYLIAATSSTAALAHAGVLVKDIVAADTDFAVARSVPVEVPMEKNVVWEAPVTSGLVAADVGLLVDLTDCNTINRGASTIDAAMVVKVISSTKGHFLLNLGGGTGEVNA